MMVGDIRLIAKRDAIGTIHFYLAGEGGREVNITGETLITDPGNAGAIPVTDNGSVSLVTGGAETRTLAVPGFVGQEIHLSLKTDGGDCVVTTAGPVNVAGNNTLTLDNESEHIFLKGIDANGTLEWSVIANDGVGLATV